MNQTSFLDKENFLKLKASLSNQDLEIEIINYLQKIENQIADFHQRKPATILFTDKTDSQTNGAFYQSEQNIIYFVRNECEPIEYLTNIKHESEHVNQEYSKLNNKNEIIMNKISAWLYPLNNSKNLSIDYTCNYLELLSKTEELQELIKLYNLQKDKINNIRTGEMFYTVFKGQEEHIQSIKPQNINKVKRQMFQQCLNPFCKIDKNIGLSKIQILQFLAKNLDKFYNKAYQNYESIKRQYDTVMNNLKQEYELNYNSTSMRFIQMEEDKINQKESTYKEISQHIRIIPIHKADYTKEYEKLQFTSFDEFICFLKTTTNKELIIEEDFKNDTYRIFYEKQDNKELKNIPIMPNKNEHDRDEL